MNQENPFIKSERDLQEKYKLYGIEDLHYLDRGFIYIEISRRVYNVTDEQEIHRIAEEVKKLYFEYKEQKESTK